MRFVEFIRPTKKKIIIFVLLVVVSSVILRLSLGIYPYWYALNSDAMSPNYVKGDTVFVKSTSFDSLEVEDVIVHSFQEGKPPLIMRIVLKNEDQRTVDTTGDNYLGIGKPQQATYKNLTEDMIIAKVVGKVPIMGYLDLFRLGWLFRIILLYLIACISVIFIKGK